MQSSPIAQVHQWFLPTFWGDIKLTAQGKTTLLRSFHLTPAERAALRVLRERALKEPLRGTAWATPTNFPEPEHDSYRSSAGVTIPLLAKIDQVAKVLGAELKKGRQTMSVVRVGGKITEITLQADEQRPGDQVEDPPPADIPPAPAPPTLEAPAEPAQAVTIAKPRVGCTMPDFGEADARACAVLFEFLTAEQQEDYQQHGCFVSVGVDTGRRYMVIHRQVKTKLAQYGGRNLYDLDGKRPLCVHDWDVPAPEEMLELHLMLHVPGQEKYLRALPEFYA